MQVSKSASLLQKWAGKMQNDSSEISLGFKMSLKISINEGM